jgi:hypothetical protein
MGATTRIKAAYSDLQNQYNDFHQQYGGLLQALAQPSVVLGQAGQQIQPVPIGAPSGYKADAGPPDIQNLLGKLDPLGGALGVFSGAAGRANRFVFKSNAKAPWVARYNDLAAQFAAEKKHIDSLTNPLFQASPVLKRPPDRGYPVAAGSFNTPQWAGPFNTAALGLVPRGTQTAYGAPSSAPINQSAMLQAIYGNGGQR